ncbi:hypothetical protein HGG75_02270 [Ochrobactrum pseudogrignonense]|nr:hypothetical protein [Brucella pseudogrignonensis]
MLTQIIIHTPVYVWGLLAYLIITGIKGRETRTVTVWRMLFVPVIFIAVGFCISTAIQISSARF